MNIDIITIGDEILIGQIASQAGDIDIGWGKSVLGSRGGQFPTGAVRYVCQSVSSVSAGIGGIRGTGYGYFHPAERVCAITDRP